MRTKQRESADWGFRVPTEGLHIVCIAEGVDILTNANSGKQSLMIPAIITEGGEDDGIKVTVFCPYKDAEGNFSEFGEQKAADVLNAVGMYEKFEEKFPGDTSLFDVPVVEAMKLKLPGTFCKMDIKLSSDGKYTNVMGVCKVDASMPDKKVAKKETTKGKADSGKTETKKPVDW